MDSFYWMSTAHSLRFITASAYDVFHDTFLVLGVFVVCPFFACPCGSTSTSEVSISTAGVIWKSIKMNTLWILYNICNTYRLSESCAPEDGSGRGLGITREGRHKRSETGGIRAMYKKKRKFEIWGPPNWFVDIEWQLYVDELSLDRRIINRFDQQGSLNWRNAGWETMARDIL